MRVELAPGSVVLGGDGDETGDTTTTTTARLAMPQIVVDLQHMLPQNAVEFLEVKRSVKPPHSSSSERVDIRGVS